MRYAPAARGIRVRTKVGYRNASGYAHLFELLGPPEGCLLALEATGHYWRNLFVALLAKGYAVAVLNPLRTRPILRT